MYFEDSSVVQRLPLELTAAGQGANCESIKNDRQRFLQQVSKKQFRTLYHNANMWVAQMDE